jgi:hypothetical protein
VLITGRRTGYHAALIAVTPLLQLSINPNLFVTPTMRLIDPWVYTGCFLSLRDYLLRFGFTYYVTRLSWVLPGYVVHHAIPSPIVANYVLHLAFFYTLMFSTYFLVASSADDRMNAFLATMLIGWSPAILLAVGWDYVDGAGITFLILTLCCLERASTARRPQGWALGAGLAIALLVAANVALIALVPICLAFLLMRSISWWGRTISRTIVSLPFVAVGCAAGLAILAGINWSLGGDWFFLRPSIQFGRMVLDSPNPYRIGGVAWVIKAPWLVLSIAVAPGAVAAIVRDWQGLSTMRGAMQAAFLGAFAIWIACHAAGMALLQVPYYMSYVAALALIAVGLQVRIPREYGAPGAWKFEAAVIVGLSVAHLVTLTNTARFWRPFEVLVARFEPETWQAVHAATPTALKTEIALAVSLAAVAAIRYARVRVAVPLLFSAVVLSGAADTDYWSNASGRTSRDNFDIVVRAHRFIDQNLVRGRPVRLWYDVATAGGRPYVALSSTYLWGWVLVNERLPTLEREQAVTLAAGTRLVIFVPDSLGAEAASAALNRQGYRFVPIAAEQFGRGDTLFTVVVGDLSPTRVQLPSGGPTPDIAAVSGDVT